MKLSQFKYNLPQENIAQYPDPNRDGCRLMVLHSKTGDIEHKQFIDLLARYDEHDLFVFNDTRVFPARLYANKEKTGARIEVFLLRELNEEFFLWDVIVDPARKIRIGNKLFFGEDESVVAEVIDNTTNRGRTLRFLYEGDHEEFKRSLYALGQDNSSNAWKYAASTLPSAPSIADLATSRAPTSKTFQKTKPTRKTWSSEPNVATPSIRHAAKATKYAPSEPASCEPSKQQ